MTREQEHRRGIGTTDALDFAPEIIKAQSRPPSPLPRAVLYALLALFGLMLAWAVFGRLDIVAVSQGKLVPQDPEDEPASSLPMKIKTERGHFTKEEKITKVKNCIKIMIICKELVF